MEIPLTGLESSPVYVIAELGQGFEGSKTQAALLIKAAAKAGADAVKFQMVFADELATPDYQYYDLFKSLEMSDETWAELLSLASELGINLQVDVFGKISLALCRKIGIETIKLHGTDIANVGFLHDVAGSNVPNVMLGAGGAVRDEIEQALTILSDKSVTLLFGFQAYPTPIATNQISRIALANVLFERVHRNFKIGFADHADPNEQTSYALAATAIGAGAKVIEKHITLGKVMEMEDHESALNPDEFAEFCKTIKDCALAFGHANDVQDFGMSHAELGYRKMIRRHVIAAMDLKEGDVIEASDVTLKRSGNMEPITDFDKVYGKKLTRNINRNSPLQTEDLT